MPMKKAVSGSSTGGPKPAMAICRAGPAAMAPPGRMANDCADDRATGAGRQRTPASPPPMSNVPPVPSTTERANGICCACSGAPGAVCTAPPVTRSAPFDWMRNVRMVPLAAPRRSARRRGSSLRLTTMRPVPSCVTLRLTGLMPREAYGDPGRARRPPPSSTRNPATESDPELTAYRYSPEGVLTTLVSPSSGPTLPAVWFQPPVPPVRTLAAGTGVRCPESEME